MAQTIALRGKSPQVAQSFQRGRQNRLTNDLSQFKLEQARDLAPVKRQNQLLDMVKTQSDIQTSRASEQRQQSKEQRLQQSQNLEAVKQGASILAPLAETAAQLQSPQDIQGFVQQNREAFDRGLRALGRSAEEIDEDDYNPQVMGQLAQQMKRLAGGQQEDPQLTTIGTEDGRRQKAFVVPGQDPIPVGAPFESGGGVTVNTADMGTASTEATEKFGAGVGERANKRLKEAESAQVQLANLDLIDKALSEGADTGLGESTLKDLRSLGNTLFGLQLPENVGQQELIQSLQSRLALKLRNPDSGFGLPGATSNRDIKFLTSAVPGLSQTEQGNEELIEAFRRLNRLKIRTARKQQEIIAENGGRVPADLDSQLQEFIEEQDILTSEEREKIAEVSTSVQSSQGDNQPTGDGQTIDFSELP